MDIPAAFRPLGEYLDGDGGGVCGIRGILGLLADGSYALCGIGEHVPELVFGRAGEGRLERIWPRTPCCCASARGCPTASAASAGAA